MEKIGINVEHSRVFEGKSAIYNAFLDSSSNLIGAVADMSAHKNIVPEMINIDQSQTSIIAIDANVSIDIIEHVLKTCGNIPVLFEPTSTVKCSKIFQVLNKNLLKNIKIITPNVHELKQIEIEIRNHSLKGSNHSPQFEHIDNEGKEN